MPSVGLVNLGCSKNQYDAEIMLHAIKEYGFNIVDDAVVADAVIINTCGFIESAKTEAIETILSYCDMKKMGIIKAVAVTGCLAERYQSELADEIPDVDVVLGLGSNAQIAQTLERALNGERIQSYGDKTSLSLEGERILLNKYFTYVKVAEGCDYTCAFCAIPMIRGKFRSRPMENIVAEVTALAKRGIKEVNLVAQDTSKYGEDLYGYLALPELLRQLGKIDGLEWIRILYCYPNKITDELLDEIRENPKVVKYLDLPIQHCKSSILRAMHRGGSSEEILKLVNKIRAKVPGIALRTTVITGFPGESNEDFEALCEFIEQARFERLGCFSYSEEENTAAAAMENQVDEAERLRRADIVREVQLRITEELSRELIGKKMRVLVEELSDDNRYIGRSSIDAPDIDTRVYIDTDTKLTLGEMYDVEIVGTEDIDPIARLI